MNYRYQSLEPGDQLLLRIRGITPSDSEMQYMQDFFEISYHPESGLIEFIHQDTDDTTRLTYFVKPTQAPQ